MRPRSVSLHVGALGMAVLVWTSSPGDARGAPDPAAPIPVVLDTDIGSDIDDTWALAHVLRSPELELRMVLCGTGDTSYRCRVAAKLLEVAGRSDVPVGLGPTGPGSHEYQRPWVEDYALADYPGKVHRDGVAAFIELVRASETPITLIAIGPLTDIAEALRRDPGLAPKIHFIGMHGSIDRGYGPEPAAEANVLGNVEAFRTVLAADWRSFEIAPLDTAGRVTVGGERYRRLMDADDPLLDALFENYRIWAERVTWDDVDYFEERSSTLFDVVAVYMAYSHDGLELETVPIAVTDDGFTLRDEAGKPARAAVRWTDLDGFRAHLTDRLLSR